MKTYNGRRVVTIDEIRAESFAYYDSGFDKSLGVCALVDVENMGFCKDGITRWYTFNLRDRDDRCIYFKH